MRRCFIIGQKKAAMRMARHSVCMVAEKRFAQKRGLG